MTEPAALGPNARRGRRAGQVVLFALLVWVIVAGSWQILRDAVFRGAPARDASACRTELAGLRARLAEAALTADTETPLSDSQVVDAFRATLGGPGGRAFDQRVWELIDGCPPEEARAAYALARLRAAHEAMLRLDALEAAPARAAHRKAVGPVLPDLPKPMKSALPSSAPSAPDPKSPQQSAP